MDLGWGWEWAPVDPDPEAPEWGSAGSVWGRGRVGERDQAWGWAWVLADRAWDLEGRACSLNERVPIPPRSNGLRCLQDARSDEAEDSDAGWVCRG